MIICLALSKTRNHAIEFPDINIIIKASPSQRNLALDLVKNTRDTITLARDIVDEDRNEPKWNEIKPIIRQP